MPPVTKATRVESVRGGQGHPGGVAIIMQGGNSLEIAKVAREEGFNSLRTSALWKVAQGITSLEKPTVSRPIDYDKKDLASKHMYVWDGLNRRTKSMAS